MRNDTEKNFDSPTIHCCSQSQPTCFGSSARVHYLSNKNASKNKMEMEYIYVVLHKHTTEIECSCVCVFCSSGSVGPANPMYDKRPACATATGTRNKSVPRIQHQTKPYSTVVDLMGARMSKRKEMHFPRIAPGDRTE